MVITSITQSRPEFQTSACFDIQFIGVLFIQPVVPHWFQGIDSSVGLHFALFRWATYLAGGLLPLCEGVVLMGAVKLAAVALQWRERTLLHTHIPMDLSHERSKALSVLAVLASSTAPGRQREQGN
jgi:hypothetical protein